MCDSLQSFHGCLTKALRPVDYAGVVNLNWVWFSCWFKDTNLSVMYAVASSRIVIPFEVRKIVLQRAGLQFCRQLIVLRENESDLGLYKPPGIDDWIEQSDGLLHAIDCLHLPTVIDPNCRCRQWRGLRRRLPCNGSISCAHSSPHQHQRRYMFFQRYQELSLECRWSWLGTEVCLRLWEHSLDFQDGKLRWSS